MPHDPSFDSTVLTIGGDAAYDAETDAWDGTPVKVEPSAGQLTQGLRPQQQLAAQHRNWIDQQMALILLALISNDAGHEVRLDADEAELADHEARVDTIENYITNLSPRIRVYTFLTSGTFVVPPRCVAMFSYGCGGGGAGGGGHLGVNAVDKWIAGGAGGGGAEARFQPILGSIPGETLNVDVGAGGAQVGPGSTGNDGQDSIVRRGGTALAVHMGAQGGRGSVGAHAITYWVHYTMGGMPIRSPGNGTMLIGAAGQGIRWDSSTSGPYGKTSDGGPHSLYVMQHAGQGGWGAGGSTNPASAAGMMNAVGRWPGGIGGAKGSDGDPNTPPGTVDFRGGGGGGGGGAGPFGAGGAGGYGDAGEASYNNSGTSALANSGAGGGGMGSTGYTDNTNFPSCAGDLSGNGGSGRVYIITIEESPP